MKAEGRVRGQRTSQMRKAVNAAVEWKPAPLARPEQTYITLGTSR